MFTFDNHTLRLFGIPVFTLLVGVLFVTAVAGLLVGIPRWKKSGAKIAVIASTLVLLAFGLVTVFVLITVGSGSMG
jgi:hypothetical protein